jgi:hypothetical protein
VLAHRVAQRLGIRRVAANGFIYDGDGRLTGEGVVRTPLNDKAAPVVAFAEELNVPLYQVVAVGNSLPDVSMFDVAGQSIAFHPEDDFTRRHATWILEDGPLDQILDLLKVPRAPHVVQLPPRSMSPSKTALRKAAPRAKSTSARRRSSVEKPRKAAVKPKPAATAQGHKAKGSKAKPPNARGLEARKPQPAKPRAAAKKSSRTPARGRAAAPRGPPGKR